jgi:predicted transcriptional regulator
VFLQTLIAQTGLVVGIVGGLIASKFLAALLTQRLFGYSRSQGHLIWSLSLPQVAATLAAAIVAFQTKNAAGVRLIDEPAINTVLVLVVVTSLLGPMLTEHFGRQLLAQQDAVAKAAAILPQSANQAGGEVSATTTSTHKEVAVPTERTVRGLETLAETITLPPPLLTVATKPVRTCRPSDPVGAAARVMHDNSSSQLPVHDGEKLVGLLTGETIARWLAARLDGGVGIPEEEPVAKVLEHQEAAGYVLVAQAATVFDGLKAFDQSLRSGTALQAIIVTANGKVTETPLGIVTPSDIPGLVRAAEP